MKKIKVLELLLRRCLNTCGCFQKKKGTPKSWILIGFSIINHPFWGTPIFGNTHVSATVCFISWHFVKGPGLMVSHHALRFRVSFLVNSEFPPFFLENAGNYWNFGLLISNLNIMLFCLHHAWAYGMCWMIFFKSTFCTQLDKGVLRYPSNVTLLQHALSLSVGWKWTSTDLTSNFCSLRTQRMETAGIEMWISEISFNHCPLYRNVIPLQGQVVIMTSGTKPFAEGFAYFLRSQKSRGSLMEELVTWFTWEPCWLKLRIAVEHEDDSNRHLVGLSSYSFP